MKKNTNCRNKFFLLEFGTQGVKYCVACHEVDAQETSKDDPVMNEQAARRLCQEHSALTIEALPSSPAQIENNPMRQEASVQSVGL